MVSTITTNDGTQYKKPTAFATGAAIIAGSNIQGLPSIIGGIPLERYTALKTRAINKTVDTVEITKAMDKALELSGLKDKGVKIFKFNTQKDKTSYQVIIDYIKNLTEIAKKRPVNPPKKSINPINALNNLLLRLTRHGHNAGFFPGNNSLYINPDKMGTAIFHEMGHAINFNSSKFWRGMQYFRFPIMIMAGILPTIALLKRKKAEGEEPKNIFDKATTFIKNNVGKLTTLAFAPIIAEELMATARGNKLAKQVLSPENVKKVIKTNRYGAITYISGAILAGTGAYLANKLRDYIASPKKNS